MIVAAMTINPVFRVMGILHVPRLTLCGFRNSHAERKNHKFISAAVLSDGWPAMDQLISDIQHTQFSQIANSAKYCRLQARHFHISLLFDGLDQM